METPLPENPTTAVEELVNLLNMEQVGPDRFEASCAVGDRSPRTFGGQTVALALVAAQRAGPEGMTTHALHASFLRPGDPRQPVDLEVTRPFEGRSFAHRAVVAAQGGVPILHLAASFHRSEDGFAHAPAMPDVPGPEASSDLKAQAAAGKSGRPPVALLSRLNAFDVRVAAVRTDTPPSQAFWFRLAAPLPVPELAEAVLAFASDFALITTAVLPHAVSYFSPALQTASLTHAIFFHERPPVSDWMLYAMDSPWAGKARGLARGSIFGRDGRLLASVAQEGLIRRRTPDASRAR